MSRIALVANWDWVLVNYQLPLARALRQHSHEVLMVCPPGKYVEVFQSEGFAWLPWQIDRRSLNPVKEAAALLRLIRLYRKVRPDIAHHFTIKPTVYGSIAARCARIPFVINSFTGLGYVFSDSWKARMVRAVVVPVMRTSLAMRAGPIILENEEDRSAFETYGLAPLDRILVVPAGGGNGVDTARFRPAEDEKTGDPVVLFAGRLLEDKGIREYVEAARALRAGMPGVQFWVAGEPDRGNPACIDAAVLSQWEAEGVVRLLGFCRNMDQLLRQVDIAVLPSYHEGLPRFLLEAAAAGLPIVATDLEGCRLVVQEGENGLLVAPRDARQLAEAIARLLEEPGERLRMGRRGREIVESRFSEERIVRQHLDLYRRWIDTVFPGAS